MVVSFLRTILIYLIVVIALRIMGKRQIGELSPTEFVITILASELASIPLQSTDTPLFHGVVPIFTLLSLEILTSTLFLKFRRFRKTAVGKNSILINNGEIDQEEMKKLRLTIDELLEEIRLKGIIDISQVKYAILESNGELSVFPFEKDSTPTKNDLKIKLTPSFLPHTLISDGVYIKSQLETLKIKEDQIYKELSKHGISDIKDVFLMQMDEGGKTNVIKKEKKK